MRVRSCVISWVCAYASQCASLVKLWNNVIDLHRSLFTCYGPLAFIDIYLGGICISLLSGDTWLYLLLQEAKTK
jgi:hypothetical protein